MRHPVAQARLIDKIFEKGKIFTLSNFMSFIRLVGAFYLYHLTVIKDINAALLLTVVLVFTDFADGYFARKFNQVSEMGKVLDPLADKFCAALTMIAIYQAYGLPFWVVAVVIGRDVLILLGSIFLVTKLPYVTPSAMPGKIAVTAVAALFLVYLLNFDPLKNPLEWLVFLMVIISFAHYVYLFFKKYRDEQTA